MPTPVSQRVTATVQRQALRLVHLQTEREAFLTTPEHPFATPRSGWVSAGQLEAGDWVVSERFGAARLLSTRSKLASRPIPVFNLSVTPSHAYFVGTDRLLVHNTRCRFTSESRDAAIEQAVREQGELKREITALTTMTPTSPRIAELRLQLDRLRSRTNNLRRTQRKEKGVVILSKDERSRQAFEADRRAAQEALQHKQAVLAELEHRPPSSEAEKSAFFARKAELERQIATLRRTTDRTSRILTLMQSLADLEKDTPATDADRLALEEKKGELRAALARERKRENDLKRARKRRATPEGREARTRYNRQLSRRQVRNAAHLADLERPRDALERLEDELARLRQETPSGRHDARIHHLTDQIDTEKKLIEIRKEIRKIVVARYNLRNAREKRVAAGKSADALDTQEEELDRAFRTLRVRRAQLRVRERFLARLDGTPWAHESDSVDEARLREFERQLAESIAADLDNEQQLADIERALDAMDPTRSDLNAAVLDQASDTDELLIERDELMRRSPSPERTAGLHSSYESLQRELREERAAVEVALSALVNEYAHIQRTESSSSGGPTWQDRLRAIHEEQIQLRTDWRVRLQTRLDSARRELLLLRSIERFHDEAVEAELARQIALLERELQMSGG